MYSKINIIFNVIQRVNTPLRISREIPRSQLSYLKVIDLDQYSLYGGWYTQVNGIFQENTTFLTVVWILMWHIYWLVILQSFFGEVNIFFRWLTTLMLKVSPICCRKHRILTTIYLVAMLCKPWLCCVFHFHRSDIYRLSQNNLKIEGRICFKSESYIGEHGHHLGCCQ